MWGIPPVNSQHKASHVEIWYFLWYNGWVNNRDAGDLRRHRDHYDVTVMFIYSLSTRLISYQNPSVIIRFVLSTPISQSVALYLISSLKTDVLQFLWTHAWIGTMNVPVLTHPTLHEIMNMNSLNANIQQISRTSHVWFVNSLALGKFEWNFRYVISHGVLVIEGWGIFSEIALRWVSVHSTDDPPTPNQVMAWCRQARSH